MDEKQKLLEDIKTFCAKWDMSPSGFSRLFLGYGNFVSDLERADFSPKLSTVTKIRTKMRNHKPKKDRHHA